jgi:hypothetical protein
MNERPILSEAEWALVVELLENERRELPVEIHHTRNSDVRQQLHRRTEVIDRLLQRLRMPAAV